MRTALTLALVILLVGCATEEEQAGNADATTTESASEDETTAGSETSRCVRVSGSLKRAIAQGLTVSGGGKLGKAAAVRSKDFEKIWYVSAVIRGPGMSSDTVGTWAANIEPNAKDAGGLIMAADSIAREFSDWGEAAAEGSAAAEVRGLENDGAQESRGCLDGK